MRQGFILETSSCVDCRACVAACYLENGWDGTTRTVYKYNADAIPFVAVTNLSLACNHCETAACMNSCPAAAYSRDDLSGAVVVETEKCIGCGYCTWNCPYGAPVFNNEGVIEKCNKCNSRVLRGVEPACSSACPTGALRYGTIEDTNLSGGPIWFPDTGLNPAIVFSESMLPDVTEIITPNHKVSATSHKQKENERDSVAHWSLIIFSTILPIAVAMAVNRYFSGVTSGAVPILLLTITASALSLFHLGKPARAYRALLNPRHSPVSREIGMLGLFSLLVFISHFFTTSILTGVSAVAGLILLWQVDQVYTSADTREKLTFHSGQVFLSGLTVAAFLLDRSVAFIFIATLRILFLLIKVDLKRDIRLLTQIARLLLIIPAILFTAKVISVNPLFVTISLFAGELVDRVLYYSEIELHNIKSEIQKHLKNDEKERG